MRREHFFSQSPPNGTISFAVSSMKQFTAAGNDFCARTTSADRLAIQHPLIHKKDGMFV
jgi:hypothetical protein